MTKAFLVAGHTFELTLPDTCKLWERLNQYTPFEVAPGASEPLFRVALATSLPESDATVVYDAPTERGETHLKMMRASDHFLIEMSPDSEIPVVATVRTSADFSSADLCIVSRRLSDAIFSVNNTLMLMYAFRTASLGTLEMHASVIGNSGKAYLFLGKSGTGKSTHSSLWLKHVPGSELMNDDNPIVRVLPDGTVMAYGSPWSGKTPCYRNVQAPVGAFVLIRQAPHNSIVRQSLLEAYATLYSSSSGFKADNDMADGLHYSLEKVVTTVPCYTLDCLPDADAARLCSETVR